MELSDEDEQRNPRHSTTLAHISNSSNVQIGRGNVLNAICYHTGPLINIISPDPPVTLRSNDSSARRKASQGEGSNATPSHVDGIEVATEEEERPSSSGEDASALWLLRSLLNILNGQEGPDPPQFMSLDALGNLFQAERRATRPAFTFRDVGCKKLIAFIAKNPSHFILDESKSKVKALTVGQPFSDRGRVAPRERENAAPLGNVEPPTQTRKTTAGAGNVGSARTTLDASPLVSEASCSLTPQEVKAQNMGAMSYASCVKTENPRKAKLGKKSHTIEIQKGNVQRPIATNQRAGTSNSELVRDDDINAGAVEALIIPHKTTVDSSNVEGARTTLIASPPVSEASCSLTPQEVKGQNMGAMSYASKVKTENPRKAKSGNAGQSHSIYSKNGNIQRPIVTNQRVGISNSEFIQDEKIDAGAVEAPIKPKKTTVDSSNVESAQTMVVGSPPVSDASCSLTPQEVNAQKTPAMSYASRVKTEKPHNPKFGKAQKSHSIQIQKGSIQRSIATNQRVGTPNSEIVRDNTIIAGGIEAPIIPHRNTVDAGNVESVQTQTTLIGSRTASEANCSQTPQEVKAQNTPVMSYASCVKTENLRNPKSRNAGQSHTIDTQNRNIQRPIVTNQRVGTSNSELVQDEKMDAGAVEAPIKTNKTTVDSSNVESARTTLVASLPVSDASCSQTPQEEKAQNTPAMSNASHMKTENPRKVKSHNAGQSQTIDIQNNKNVYVNINSIYPPAPSDSENAFLNYLLTQSRTNSIKYREEYYARDESEDFMKDVVSFWNTPCLGDGYIILGVREKPKGSNWIKGLNETLPESYYQELFDDDCFTVRPLYTYEEKTFEGKRIGIIRVTSSEGENGPAVAKEEATGARGHHVFMRVNCDAVVATKSRLQDVQEWFASPKTPPQKSSGDHGESLLQSVDNFETERFYCLLVGKLDMDISDMANLTALSRIPWIKVFDFDPCSDSSGVFSYCEQELKSSTSLYISTVNDTPRELCKGATDWFFVRGKGEGNVKELRQWKRDVHGVLNSHCEKIAELCSGHKPLTALVLWCGDRSLFKYFEKVLESLDLNLHRDLKIAFCLGSDIDVGQFIQTYGESLDVSTSNVHSISIPKVCSLIWETDISTPQKKYHILPKSGEESVEKLTVEMKDVIWLREDFDVLYWNYDYKPQHFDESKLGSEFVHGHTISWHEISLGYDIDRGQVKKEIVNRIQSLIQIRRSCKITLHHEPGAGGTTLGRGILWRLHESNNSICVYLHHLSKDTDVRISWLHNHTRLPIVLLFDSNSDDATTDMLLKTCMRNTTIILLKVRRFVGRIESCGRGDKFYLKGAVTENEARCLTRLFGEFYPEKAGNLQQLVKDVEEGKMHEIYMFGLTCLDYNYRGLQSYVAGYLALESKDLEPWQKIIAYLALVHYYGHCGLHGYFFSTILGNGNGSSVRFSDLPYKAKRLIISEEGTNVWRINMHAVAKEILEQVLCPEGHPRDTGMKLSLEARKNLQKLARDFILDISKKSRNGKLSRELNSVLVATFIFRQNRENFSIKKDALSMLLSDIPSRYPYTERLEVLQKLAEKFPRNPSFLAQLGRFYALEREEYATAHDCISKAIAFREEEIERYQSSPAGSTIDVCSAKMQQADNTLVRFYHMKGVVYQRELSNLIGQFHSPTAHAQKIPFDMVHDLAEAACSAFKTCRSYYKSGYAEECGYLQEIQVRLSVLEFNREKVNGGIVNALRTGSRNEIVETNLAVVDSLILECYSLVDDLSPAFSKAVDWCKVIFKDVGAALKMWHGYSIFGRRSKIAAYRVKHDCSMRTSWLDISTKEDVLDIISLYEKNFSDVYERGADYSLETDMKEWLQVIRHSLVEDPYTVEHVLDSIRPWNDSAKSPYSQFYNFVLTALLALGNDNSSGSRKCFVETNHLLPELIKARKFVNRPRQCREWLGKNNGNRITQLIHFTTLGEWDPVKRFWKNPESKDKLEIKRGTIQKCNNELAGEIEIDAGIPGSPGFTAFYVPKTENMYGRRFMNTRVEFYVGFSFEHGIEAYHVTELGKRRCEKCNRQIEVSQNSEQEACSACGHRCRGKH
uniref:Uncharacterized protein LOC116956944 n=1 Tax=Petromyzon marinus TaxID=7757 RepID=A0AAJ7UGB9_PETMA|nr:uncharacterized protein LOC116956944 [Petromyzon marinus]